MPVDATMQLQVPSQQILANNKDATNQNLEYLSVAFDEAGITGTGSALSSVLFSGAVKPTGQSVGNSFATTTEDAHVNLKKQSTSRHSIIEKLKKYLSKHK